MEIEDSDTVLTGNSEENASGETEIITAEPEDEMNIYFWLSMSFLAIFILSYFIL